VYKRLGGKRGHGKSRGLYFLLWTREGKSLGTVFFVHHRTVSAVKKVVFVSYMMSYTL
jgi:hypothetical protein